MPPAALVLQGLVADAHLAMPGVVPHLTIPLDAQAVQHRAAPLPLVACSLVLPVEIDFAQPFSCSDWAAWDAEYAESVAAEPVIFETRRQPLCLGPTAVEFSDQALVDRWHRAIWDDVPQLAGPFDDEFSFHPRPETEDDYFGAPF